MSFLLVQPLCNIKLQVNFAWAFENVGLHNNPFLRLKCSVGKPLLHNRGLGWWRGGGGEGGISLFSVVHVGMFHHKGYGVLSRFGLKQEISFGILF